MTQDRVVLPLPFVVWRWTEQTHNAAVQARTALGCALDQLGCVGEAASDVVWAVSELVANAVEHAVGPYEMRLRPCEEQGIVCEVEDGDPRIPPLPNCSKGNPLSLLEENRGGGSDALWAVLSEHGRGLRIVHYLTHGHWGFQGWESGKVAWVRLPDPDQR
ncbi:ATP-binding protein [Streptomyces sp. WAC 00631]|uniref:ATP-binding protein n=1 Tax=Streptomyces sp. WAC 00631 TaxID=2203201 RepID=UPI000F77EDA4|nr:ATP-binding protein [Streptomyces sp. WAC 00631]MCC5033492.1 ATP-binding protein [Streptomyces sp. WAC 00631]